jgi:Carbamoyl-phosphate synthase L chain, ATP binding domain
MSRRILFACGSATGEALRCANAIRGLEGVTLLDICEEPDSNDVEQLIRAAKNHGAVDRIVTAQETLLLPVAEANEALGLEAMSSETVKRTLDKSKLKATLRSAGVKTPRSEVVTTLADARRFASEVGFPIVVKPLHGSGALTTFRIGDDARLARILNLIDGPMIAETCMTGKELCFDTVTISNEPQCYSVCCYDPPIIEALENPQRQWRCVIPRDVTPYDDFIREGLAAVRALEVGNAITHMEGFMNAAGPGGFVDATLRPAGARIGPMFGYAFDVDPYRLWARVAVDGCFDGPLERKYSVGTIFLRGTGSGSVSNVQGVEAIEEELNELIVESHWPQIGVPKAQTYTGDGFVTVRHPQTSVVQNALDFIDRTLKITYSSATNLETLWADRLRNFKELNRPAWDNIPVN